MADEIIFNDTLALASGLGSTTLSGTLDIVYGPTSIVTGSLALSAGIGFTAQIYSNLTVVQSGTGVGGVPLYTLTGLNTGTKITINYAGALPTSVSVGVTNTINVALASGVGNVVSNIVCFAQGTLILTQRGEIAVEALAVGDMVTTASGKRRAIKWLGHRTIDCRRHPEPRAVLPIRIASNAFGPNQPSRDLMVSPGHGILVHVVDEVLMPASLLCNGSTVQQIEVDELTYWHVEFDNHDILFSNGLRSESYIDVGNRAFFSDEAVARPDGTLAASTLEHYCRPYIVDENVIRVVRRRLQARAMSLGWTMNTSPLADLHLLIDGKVQLPKIVGLNARFVVPAGAEQVWLNSTPSVAAYVVDSVDMRRLGVCLRGLNVDGRSIVADDPLLCVGFYAAEGEGPTLCRWTTGRGLLPSKLWCESAATSLVVELAGPSLPRWTPPSMKETALRRAA